MGTKRTAILVLIGLVFIFVFRNHAKNGQTKSALPTEETASFEQRTHSNSVLTPEGIDAHKTITKRSEGRTETSSSNEPELHPKGDIDPIPKRDVPGARLTENSQIVGTSPKEAAKINSPELLSAPAIVIPPKEAKGGVYALYRAVLWRDPDPDGGQNATNLFSSIGWSTYIENSRNMISSPEFEERIIPNHDTVSIINRIYSVFLGRCPKESELTTHFEHLENNEPGQITETVLKQVKPPDVQQIFRGGYNPSLCAKTN